MPVFRDHLLPGSPFQEPTEGARRQAASLVEDEPWASEAELQLSYITIINEIATFLPRTPPLRLQPNVKLDRAPGPTGLFVNDTCVLRDLRGWANNQLPEGTSVESTWGPNTPDLLLRASSRDRRRHVGGASGELKANESPPTPKASSHGGHAPTTAGIFDSGAAPRVSNGAGGGSANKPWIKALAQEAIYALECHEMYGTRRGFVGVGTAMSRLVVLKNTQDERVLAVDLHHDLCESLPPRVDLAYLLDHIRSPDVGRVGAFDLRGADGELNDSSLERLWVFWLGAFNILLDQDDSVTARLSPPSHALSEDTTNVNVTGTRLLMDSAALRDLLQSAASALEAESENEEEAGDDDDDDDLASDPSYVNKKVKLNDGGCRPITRKGVRTPSTGSSSLTPPPEGTGVGASAAYEPVTANEPGEGEAGHRKEEAEDDREDIDASTIAVARVAAWLRTRPGDDMSGEPQAESEPEPELDSQPPVPQAGPQYSTPSLMNLAPERIAASRALYEGRESREGSVTSNGSLIAPERWDSAVTALKIKIVPVSVSDMDHLLSALHRNQRP